MVKDLITITVLLLASVCPGFGNSISRLQSEFISPPESSRPWVYWMVMDGNLTREGITADLEAMRRAGIGGVMFLEVDLGLPRGPVKFMSPEWRSIFTHAVRESERLGIEIALPTGPGWCGAGGPWVTPEQTMQHLVGSETNVTGPMQFNAILPQPKPNDPFFGKATLTPEYEKLWREFYRDVAIVAFPTPESDQRLPDITEKAIYQRAPYSSFPGVKSYLPMSAEFPEWPAAATVARTNIIELTHKLAPNGSIVWDVPPGKWTIVRFGRTVTGQLTRPAPLPGLGFEVSKFDAAATRDHLEKYVGTLLDEVGHRKGSGKPGARRSGLTHLHFDSWEMSAQNWSPYFRAEFKKRRGYDPLPFLPAYLGRVVESREFTERFLWDLRQTGQELTIENHIKPMAEMAHRNGMLFSIEPYDMNPNSDMALGGVADVPMSEFWWLGFNTTYSVIEAASVAHTMGRNIVAAESFTSEPGEDWQAYPATIKSLGDWSFAAGVNRIAFHRYQHQPWMDRFPGMRMGPYGIHWERTQTFWHMLPPFHQYLARCQHLLRQGQPVADILFLAGEGAPHVFRPPPSATIGSPPDRRGYNFDGCEPGALIERAVALNKTIQFTNAAYYKVLVLPEFDTMTPALLKKVGQLAQSGVPVIGAPPKKSPSLSGYPSCDAEVRQIAAKLWDPKAPNHVLWGPEFEAAQIKSEMNPLEGATWIWLEEDGGAPPVGKRWFAKEITLPESAKSSAGKIHITADNVFDLTVNGHAVGVGNNFTQISTYDLKPYLRAGKNSILVRAENAGDGPNPAGLIVKGEITLADGTTTTFQTDRSWLASADPKSINKSVREVCKFGEGAWGRPNPASQGQPTPPTYPSYESIATVLAAAGLPEDFESDAPIRYTHRKTTDADIYFVANRSEAAVEANCSFRVTGATPELWHPVEGSIRPLPQFAVSGDRTKLTLRFEPIESYFIVFRKASKPTTKAKANFADLTTAKPIEGSWDVTFLDAWKQSHSAAFNNLEDWSKHTDPAIRYFSGTAVYCKTLNISREELKSLSQEGRVYLDLGVVKNIAQVRINGCDAGTVWCAPWRVDITKHLRNGDNKIEISVANLWINRLIGDSGLPKEKQRTWTSQNPYKPDSPLRESGLLGPVSLLTSQ